VWPDFHTRRAAIVEERSSARWASEIRTPLLILHGGADRSVALSHSVRLAERLEAAGREYRLIVAGGQVHTLRDATGQRDAWLVDWFRAHDGR